MIADIAKIPIQEDKFNEALEAFKQLIAEVAKAGEMFAGKPEITVLQELAST